MIKYIRCRVVHCLISLMLLFVLVFTIGCAAAEKTTSPLTTTAPKYNPGMSQASPTYTRPPATVYASPEGPRQTVAPAPAPRMTGAVPPMTTTITIPGDENIGFSVGGAKDIGNFRENIENDYLPLAADVTYEGLFYDYYFDTGAAPESDKLFYPSYSTAVTRDPLSGEVEYYLSVGLNSGLKESDFARKKLNLVIVLDVSGSMDQSFDSYYYDGGNYHELSWEEAGRSKIQVARESVAALLDRLNDGDSFGIVLFDNHAGLLQPLRSVEDTDMRRVKDHVLALTAGGSTNLDDGMQMATELFDDYIDADADEYENRIIVLTDAQPNTGDTSEYGLLSMVKSNAWDHIYTTFIGIGVDFNSELIDGITKTRGANYYSVHSAYQFRKRLVDEFDYMVTPLVFDLQLELDGRGWEIEEVYGSPEANKSTGELMKINTLFPSASEGEETRGGLVLLKLKKTWLADEIYLRVSYEDRNGRADVGEAVVRPESFSPEYFDNSGIRKGVLLIRYADLLKNWIIDERNHYQYGHDWEPCVNEDTGIIAPPYNGLGQWERQSMPLTVSRSYERLFGRFLDYFSDELEAIDDNDLIQEIEVLETLIEK